MENDRIETLKADVSSGIDKVRALCFGDLKEIEDALMEGDLEKAAGSHRALGGRLQALHHVEQNFAAIGAGQLVFAKDLSEGMELQGVGKVTAVETGSETCVTGRHEHPYVSVSVERYDEPLQLAPDQRMVVLPSREPDTASDPA